MKLCFSTLGCCERSLEDIIALAKEYGIGALEIRGISGVLDNTAIEDFSPENREKTAEAFRKSRVVPAVLGTSCAFHNADKLDAAIAQGIASVEIAEALGIKNIRVFGDRLLQDDEGCTDRVISGIKTICRTSEKVNVLLEVHGDYNTIETLSPIVEALSATKNFGLIWDIGHTHAPYGEAWSEFYDFARPYIKHIHIKDGRVEPKSLTLIGEGEIPIIPIVKRLVADGYDGCFSLEWEKKWHPELPDIKEGLDSFVSVMSKAEA